MYLGDARHLLQLMTLDGSELHVLAVSALLHPLLFHLAASQV
jgi:hypothetical protein